MAARGNSAVKQQRTSQGFRRALASAILEWLLIFFLFIDAIFSYLITRFACYCELQTPCLLCSRLDHVLGKKKLKCYWDLFCGSHKLEISSLGFCHVHNKLVDVHGMCENCLFSFATVNKSNTETYRLLVGKLGEDYSFGFDEEPLPQGHHNNNQSSVKHCSCCNEPWIPRGYAQKLIQTKSIGSETSELDLPVSDAGEHSLHYLKKRNEKRSIPIRATHVESSGPDPLSHVGYTELKITSDTESEVLSDDDDADAVIHETSGPKDDLAHKCVHSEPHVITLSHESVLEKLIDPAIAPEPLIPFSQLQSDIILPDNDKSVASTTAVRHSLEELREQIGFKADPSELTELISLNDVPSSSNAEKTSIDVSIDSELINHNVPPPSNFRESLFQVTEEMKLISLDEVSPPSNAETPVNESEETGLNYHNVPPPSNSRESLVDATEESKLIFLDQVHLSSDAKRPVHLSEESKLISANDVPSSPKGRDTHPELSKDGKVILPDDIPPMSNAAQSPIVVSEESKLISVSNISSTGMDTPSEMSKDSKVILLDDVPPVSNPTESAVNVLEESKIISVDDVPSPSNGRDTPEVSEDSKVILPDDVPQLSNDTGSSIEATKESCVSRSDENEETSNCKAGSEPNTSNEPVTERNSVSSDTGLQASNLLDLSDAYKVAVGNRGRQLSGLLAEQWTGKDSSRLSEDLKLLLSQLSATRGFEQVLPDMSPKVSFNSDDSSSNGMQLLQKRISLERNESGFESLDGSTVSEIEGESVVDRLKRQVEHDKKLLSALYRELEEERNASAVAVNQSMAMITRLQEEKASLHMEALQNLRMMEEQAEYDMEALQKTNDLLAEKEKEIQDLEEELEFYRKKFPNVYTVENMLEPTHDCKEREIRMDHSKDTCGEDRAATLTNSVIKNLETDMPSDDTNTAAVKNSLLEFEDERSYILRSLKKLEKKLYMFSYNGLCSDLVNGEYSGNGVNVSDSEDINCNGVPLANSRTEWSDLSMVNNASASRGSPRAHGHVSSHEKPQLTSEENTELNCSGQTPVLCGGTDLASLGNEVADLNERLEALEADQNFLELTIKSLKNEEGTRFIREIASHLQELRRIGLRRDETFA
ncbi:myosin-binding protein 1-like [Pistacia vera]|uniref:myosin-binding protein 1-like n=1 Tax=Pistacia vera TaxID=55513 RepID=UPI001262D0EA|nr:myosin-binding protein 1-like [Pistacia vera]